ncbi:MAG: class I SAM-dependent methyltransferase [Eubacteriales bacterium]|nr:class I SAM-dependent methyltransferase [Eubacteriales bacterium]
MYKAFADVYDTLMQDVDYATWANYYISLLQTYAPQAKNIMECGCGTGALTQYFAEQYQTQALDISAEMLQIAYNKMREAGAKVAFSNQDMRKFATHKPLDAVLATCDAVNYLTQAKDVEAFFTSANKALKAGGLLIFDVSSPYKLYTLLPSMPWVRTDENISYIWQNFVEEQILYMQISLFIKENGHYIRMEEEQQQCCFSQKEYTVMLQNAGFDNIQFFGEQSKNPPQERDSRWHVLAQKK